MKKIVWMACGMALLCAPLSASANVRYDDPQEKVQKKEVPNPEKAAQRRTDEMDKALNLTEKQYKKIYKLFLKEEKEKVEAMMQRHPGGMDGQPPMAGRPRWGEDALRWEVECHRRVEDSPEWEDFRKA
jgi:Spy/CpxP family protein refolding chaperone